VTTARTWSSPYRARFSQIGIGAVVTEAEHLVDTTIRTSDYQPLAGLGWAHELASPARRTSAHAAYFPLEVPDRRDWDLVLPAEFRLGCL